MYDAFYGFREKPFSLLPDPDYLYLSPQHEKALGLLELSLHNQAGFCVISGEIGAGKTTLIRKLLTLASPEFRVGLVSNTLDSFGELLNWILLAYDLPGGGTSVEQHERFLDYIIQQYGRGRRTVLIIDEAQNLGVDALEELRMLSNVNADKHQVLQVILVGQSGLRDTLKRPELAQFAQRILMDFHLGPLGREDTAHYIRHRVLVAGADPQLFTDAAAAAVFRYSGGVPRIINLLCDTALVYGYAEGRSSMDAELIHAVVRERQSSSAAPALRLAAVAPPAAVRAVEPVPEVDAMPVPEADVPAASPPPPAMEPPSVAEPEAELELEPEADSTQTEAGPLVDAVAPSTTVAAELQGDAEWLRQLADSAVPPALREAAQIEPEPPAPVSPLVAEPAPARKTASRPASRARRTGLGRAAGVLLLLTAGVAGYGYFSGEEQDPAQAAETPIAVVPAPVAPPSAESRPAPPPESPRPEAVETVPTPEPLAESGRPPAEAPASPPAPAPDESTAEAEPELAVAREPAAPPPVPSAPKRAAPKPVSRQAPASEPVPVSEPAAAPVPKPARVAPEPDPEPLPLAASPARSESSAEVVEAPSRPSVVEEESSTADAAPVTAEPQPFTTDPCRGPAARYLSTCR
ncbi:MAG TPA: AAA family ATPase [Gammaproteobacteria bacterium]|nr:AAA family ATPase [Gammaproteobacteria bacterium]